MTITQIFILSIVQGITEFLPISSSAHLILFSKFANWNDHGLLIDLALHAGTLLSVITYFRRDIINMINGTFKLLRMAPMDYDMKIASFMITAAVPVAVAGSIWMLNNLDQYSRSSISLIGWSVMIFGVILYLCDHFGKKILTMENLSFKHSIIAGIAQAIAIIPGVSRSGIVISAARMMGYTPENAAKIALLMSVPTIIMSSAASMILIIQHGNFELSLIFIIAIILSFISSFITLAILMRFVRKFSMTPFVFYRIITGALLIWIAST